MPSLVDRISGEMKAALLGGDRFRGDLLRNIKAAILNEEVAQGVRGQGLSDSDTEKVIARELKKRQESLLLFHQNDRDDLADIEAREAAVLQEFLPQQLGETEVQKLVDQAVADLGGVESLQLGQLIGKVKSQAGASVDGAMLARLAKKAIN